MRMLRLAVPILVLAAVLPQAAADTYTITFDAELREEPATGRVILFFITESGGRWNMQRPMDGPFFESPQPIASIAVKNWRPGEPMTLDASVVAFPRPLDELDYPQLVRVQAVLDLADNPERSHTDGPGNLYSDPVAIQVSADSEDHYWLELTNEVSQRELSAETDHLRWIEFRSEMLSEFYGRDIFHRAGIALPPGYLDENSERTQWPTIYVIPGYGGREDGALVYANIFRAAAKSDFMPMGMPEAVVIVLDPESPLGHHGFTNSPNHGPRGSALVQEFIPHLEAQFKLASQPEARIVTGHSSGGWTSLWLQLNWPNTFGACWASAPDPIDFSAFQVTNLYEEDDIYIMRNGHQTPSHRKVGPAGGFVVTMTVRQERQMEHAIHPLGGSGQQWDAWMAMFSPKDEATGFPALLFDVETGEIDREVVEHWAKYDIARLVEENWERLSPIVLERVRIAVGEKDSFFLERAVRRFDAKVAVLRGGDESSGPGYILFVPGADHGTISFVTQQRWNREMSEHFREHGLHD